MSQNIYRDDKLIFKAIVKVAYLKDGKPSKIPIDILDIFKGI